MTNSNISDNDYYHACEVYKKFKCKTLKDYLRLYLYVDVVLLSDIFQNFRNLTMQFFELDPVHFITTPNLSWHAGLKMSKSTLELLTDIDMYQMIESGIRGGICLVSKRFARANNPYLKQTFNKSLPTSYIISLDVNNPYGSAMANNKLPISQFRWLTFEEIEKFNVMKISDTANKGYILSVDLDYPQSLHDKHNNFPMAPEHKVINYELLSPYQKEMLKILKLKSNSTPKLLTTLERKNNYVLHYRNLKFYVKHGLVIKQIHKVLEFKQTEWIKPYIIFNNDKRKESTNEFDKQFFKLMNNAFFGRTCMNIRKHVNVKVALNKKECRKCLMDCNLDFFSILNDSAVLFKNLKSSLYLNQPIYVGFTVLELSKLYMYELYYDVFKQYYDTKVNLLYSDTDSLVLEIFTEDVYYDMKYKFKNILDFSNYDISHEMFTKEHQGCLGYLKDETKGIPIQEFCGLRPKMYSYTFGQNNKRTAKGIKKYVLNQELNHNMYLNILKTKRSLRHKQCNIISKKHNVTTVLTNKISLSPYYDKMFLCNDAVTCYAFGHYSTK